MVKLGDLEFNVKIFNKFDLSERFFKIFWVWNPEEKEASFNKNNKNRIFYSAFGSVEYEEDEVNISESEIILYLFRCNYNEILGEKI